MLKNVKIKTVAQGSELTNLVRVTVDPELEKTGHKARMNPWMALCFDFISVLRT